MTPIVQFDGSHQVTLQIGAMVTPNRKLGEDGDSEFDVWRHGVRCTVAVCIRNRVGGRFVAKLVLLYNNWTGAANRVRLAWRWSGVGMHTVAVLINPLPPTNRFSKP